VRDSLDWLGPPCSIPNQTELIDLLIIKKAITRREMSQQVIAWIIVIIFL
jgi:hypothetical protein